MVDIESLLPRSRSPADYLKLVIDPRIDAAGLLSLAGSPYPFVRVAVAAHPLASSATLAVLATTELDPWDRNHVLATIASHPITCAGASSRLDGRPPRPAFATPSRRWCA